MRIALGLATQRGVRCLHKVAELAPEAELVVFAAPELPGEPAFVDDLRLACQERGARFEETRDLGAARFGDTWAEVDLLLLVHWRALVPPGVHGAPRRGSYVFHDSLLPEYRGFSPTVWAMINGEDHVGASLFEIADDPDTGDLVDQERVEVGPTETIAEVFPRVTEAYLLLLERRLGQLLAGTAPRVPQDHARATWACKRLAEDNLIDWSAPTQRVFDLVRSVTRPYPGAFTSLRGRRLIVWRARPVDHRVYAGRVPGRVVEVLPGKGCAVLTGDGALLVEEVQLEGEEPQPAHELLTRLACTLGR
jgi:methionyl-tRNA formyltransferase